MGGAVGTQTGQMNMDGDKEGNEEACQNTENNSYSCMRGLRETRETCLFS